ncbi:hypothetical protein [Sphingomonas sp. VNH70]|uniref:hypothetical protein n=1 Tax=Sphingomonas silueang TaxID=3156617 RepID=UPI0032B4AB80
MRYARAHWWLAALLPLIVLAFWPGYFADLRGASLAHHVHGIAGTLWLALAWAQSRAIATRRFALHAALGRALFVAVPLFAAGAALAIVALATTHVAAANPFNARFGGRLAPIDTMSMILLPLLVRDALVHRRRADRHAAAMLATVLLVLPPVLGRLAGWIPGFPPGFEPSFHAAQLVSAAIAAGLWWRDRRGGAPFAVVAVVLPIQSLSFALWDGQPFVGFAATLPPLPFAAVAAAASLELLWTAWRPTARRRESHVPG